ncbi:MAG: endonuclease MutS2, partial [Bacteroidales bacterium]|nr:endonuclease MutS2 [Bacteroidales bacterium]
MRTAIQDRCSTDYAAARVENEDFCTSGEEIHRRHLLTDEMRLILMFEDNFPTSGYIDALPFLEPIGKNASIDLLSLGKLRTLLDTLKKALHFFHTVKEGIYPNLQHLASGITAPADVIKRIDSILDRHGEIKDTASDELYSIRRSIKEQEINISKRMNAILRKAQQDGLTDADASVAIRDGKMLIPVSAAKKRQFAGFVYDESATGKTTFMEPAEVVALQNEIAELHFAETREIARILYEFAEFLRPYVPELLSGATLLGELDFIMAKAHVALDYIAGMPVLSE